MNLKFTKIVLTVSTESSFYKYFIRFEFVPFKPGTVLQRALTVCLKIQIIQRAIKDVRAHCYCASLLRTLYMTWRVPRHVFQARAPSRNPTKYRADDLCGNLICEYFCWMPGDPHFLFGRSLPFLILSIIPPRCRHIYFTFRRF